MSREGLSIENEFAIKHGMFSLRYADEKELNSLSND